MNSHKIIGAVLAGLSVILYYGIIIWIIILNGFLEESSFSFMLIFLLILLCIPLFGVTLALIYRIREIQSGEEEEAKKY